MSAPVAMVLGATGFVGREIVRQLGVRDTRVIAHVRPDSKELDRWRTTFTEQGAIFDATPWDQAALAERMKISAVTHLYLAIGTTRAKAKADAISGNIYETVDYGLTKLAADAARDSGMHPRIVYLSSIGASPESSSQYLAWRGKAEQAVVDAGLDYVIARPSIINGERDSLRLGEKAASIVGDGVLAVAGLFGGRRLRDKYKSTSPDVLASALIRLGEADGHPRQIAEGAELR